MPSGEKDLIRRFVRKIFGGPDDDRNIGDDCAVLRWREERDLVVSIDRTPEDLIAWRLGVIDAAGLGRYAARLGLSDLAARGAEPLAVLTAVALPASWSDAMFEALCHGLEEASREVGARIVGGDITAGSGPSVTVAVIGSVPTGRALRRWNARPGDVVFVSRPVGIAPAAFRYLRDLGRPHRLGRLEDELLQPLYGNPPMFELAHALRESHACTSLMDNTDGYSECFHELAEESSVAFIISADAIAVPRSVKAVAECSGEDPLELALGPGMDFGLVGTVSDPRVIEELRADFPDLCIVGHVEEGTGVFLERDGRREPLPRRGWDYFTDTARTGPGPKPRP